jgi:hypothetical protein
MVRARLGALELLLPIDDMNGLPTLRHGLDPNALTDIELLGASKIVIVEHISASHLH